MVYGAARDDATRLNFEEGPVFPQSYRYLEERGIESCATSCATKRAPCSSAYRAKSGKIYNG